MGKKLAFMGAGAVGGYVGGHLARAGEDVTLIDPWPEHIDTIKQHGLHLEGTQGEYLVHPKALHLHEVLPLPTDLDEDPGDTGAGKVAHEGLQPRILVGQEDTCGQQELPAAQQPRDVRDLGGVRPTDRAVEEAGSGAQHRVPVGDGGQGEHLGHGGVDLGQPVLRGIGVRRHGRRR